MQYSAVKCNSVLLRTLMSRIVLLSIVQCSEVQWSAVQCSAVQWRQRARLFLVLPVPMSYVLPPNMKGKCCAVQCSSEQFSAVQCSAVQCSAVPCSDVLFSAFQYITVQCSVEHHNAVQCNTVITCVSTILKRAYHSTRLIQQDFGLYQKIL